MARDLAVAACKFRYNAKVVFHIIECWTISWAGKRNISKC